MAKSLQGFERSDHTDGTSLAFGALSSLSQDDVGIRVCQVLVVGAGGMNTARARATPPSGEARIGTAVPNED